MIPLSYIDDNNAIVPASIKAERWHRQLQQAGEEMKLRWDTDKDWEGKQGKHLGVYLKDEKRHWKERVQKARAMWEQVRRLTRLPVMAKKAIVCGQLLSVLCYGCEAFSTPNEEMIRLSRMWARWVIGAWSGSNAEKVAHLSGCEQIQVIFERKNIQWAGSVYGRHLPTLRNTAEKILRTVYEGHGNIQWQWMTEEMRLSQRQELSIQEWDEAHTQEYTDGSRLDDAAAAGTTKEGEYLGSHAAVMDAEMLGITMALRSGSTRIALDSQAAIHRATQLYIEPARSWIELQLQKAIRKSSMLMWVKGHSGVKGNEAADRKAKLRAYGGRVMQVAERITPAGIRQDFPIHSKPAHLSWSQSAVKGLTYVVTNRGPLKRWMWVIGRSDEQNCQCGEPQNAVHLRRCKLVGDGKGQSIEECMKDSE